MVVGHNYIEKHPGCTGLLYSFERCFPLSEPTLTISRAGLLRNAVQVQEALSDLIRVIQHRDRERACCYDLSVSQCQALQAIVRRGPLTVNQLSDELFLEKSTVSRLAASLLKKGVIRKRAPESDGRVVILQVTESGLRLSRRILNDLTEEYTALLEEFEPNVQEAMPRILSRLSHVLSARVDGPNNPCC